MTKTHEVDCVPMPRRLLEVGRALTRGDAPSSKHLASRYHVLEAYSSPSRATRWSSLVPAALGAALVLLVVLGSHLSRHRSESIDDHAISATPSTTTSEPPVSARSDARRFGPENDRRRIVTEHRGECRECFEIHSADYERGAQVKLELQVVIAPDGKVSRAEAVPPSPLGTCVATRATTWVFDASGQESTLVVPLTFVKQ